MANYDHVAVQGAIKDFQAEVRAQCYRYGYMSQESLGDVLDVSQVTAGKYLKDPDAMTLRTIRKLVRAIKPDPLILLKAMGYTSCDIKQFVKELER